MTITVNGAGRELAGTSPHTTLLEFLRSCGLTGAKEGCAEGECGACSVLVARPDGGGARWTAINACLTPAAACAGQEVVTAEGLGTPTALHPVQHQMAHRGGSQCGYCTPGFVCSMAAEYYRPERGHRDSEHDEETGPNGFDLHALSGNLCRCTGYRPIRDAAYALGAPAADDPLAGRCGRPVPPAAAARVETEAGTFVRPATLAEAVEIVDREPDAVPVAGATDHGVEVNLRGLRPRLLVAIDRLPDLRTLVETDDHVEIGAALTLSEIERGLGGRIPLLDLLWPQFASRLIRNAATLGGNLGTASPIGDAAPALLALESSLVLASVTGERVVPLADYFTGYRQTVRRSGELIRAVRIPLPLAPTVGFHKIAKRRFDDISSVAVAFAVDVVDAVVVRARIGLGGVAATPIRALATEAALEGRAWGEETIEDAARVLAAEGTPISDQRASASYRREMLGNSVRRLGLDTGSPGGSPNSTSEAEGGGGSPYSTGEGGGGDV